MGCFYGSNVRDPLKKMQKTQVITLPCGALVLIRLNKFLMQNVSIKRASDLPEEMKAAVERLLGRQIQADEEISIAAIPPQHVAPRTDRLAIARRLDLVLNRRAEKVRDVSDEELDTTIDEAVDHVRHSRR